MPLFSIISPFIQLPEGVRKEQRSDKIYNNAERRAVVGDLVFATSMHIESRIRTGQTVHKIGQVLEFGAAVDIDSADAEKMPYKAAVLTLALMMIIGLWIFKKVPDPRSMNNEA